MIHSRSVPPKTLHLFPIWQAVHNAAENITNLQTGVVFLKNQISVGVSIISNIVAHKHPEAILGNIKSI